MFDSSYTQTLQDQIGQLSKLLGAQQPAMPEAPVGVNRFDCVDGLEGARSFQAKMMASSKHIVWDSTKDTFYVLQKDANGNPARIQICDYTVAYEPSMDDKYVTREDFNQLVAKLDKLIKKEETNG